MAQNNSVNLFGEVVNIVLRESMITFKLRVARHYKSGHSLGFDRFKCVLVGDRRCDLFKTHVSDHDFVMIKGHLEMPDQLDDHNKIIVEQFAKGYHHESTGDA